MNKLNKFVVFPSVESTLDVSNLKIIVRSLTRLFLWCWVLSQSIYAADPVISFQFSPVAIRSTCSASIQLTVLTDGTPTSAKVTKTGQTDIVLSKSGPTFSATIPCARALSGYSVTNYHHNHLGTLRLYQGATEVFSPNIHVNVVDAGIPHVISQTHGTDRRDSPHLVNLKMSAMDPQNTNNAKLVAQKFYDYYSDRYDFLNIIYLPERFNNRFHFIVHNSVAGLGLNLFNDSALYGSAVKLKGITVYPISSYFDLAERSSIHEIAHQWINFMDDLPALEGVYPHWPISTLGYGIIGIQDATSQGLQFPWKLQLLGNPPQWRCAYAGTAYTFNDMELYLMGLIPPDEVITHRVFQNQNQTCQANGDILSGAVNLINAQTIINKYGNRSPSYVWSQKSFTAATILVSQSLLSDLEMDFFDYFAARGNLTSPVPYSMGLISGVTYPFFAATGGRACLVTRIDALGGCYQTGLPVIRR